jgi:prepilin-type processing-associated H-X9-DG protein
MKDTTDSSVVLAYDKPTPALREGMNMVFLDGHVEFVRWDLVRKIFKPTNEYLKEMKLTEVDVDALLKAAGQR